MRRINYVFTGGSALHFRFFVLGDQTGDDEGAGWGELALYSENRLDGIFPCPSPQNDGQYQLLLNCITDYSVVLGQAVRRTSFFKELFR